LPVDVRTVGSAGDHLIESGDRIEAAGSGFTKMPLFVEAAERSRRCHSEQGNQAQNIEEPIVAERFRNIHWLGPTIDVLAEGAVSEQERPPAEIGLSGNGGPDRRRQIPILASIYLDE
jgi:hypothetical protein